MASYIESPTPSFSVKQQKAFDDYKAGKNIFITGPGGCGKSYIIRSIYKDALKNGKNIKVTSLTGCSAILLNCNATTIHKWSSIGLAKGEDHDILFKIRKTKRTKNYLDTEILIIDEVSMMSEKVFELLDYLCKNIRKVHHRPFGGIQLICCGDFYQLPPVCVDKALVRESNFCFQSSQWGITFDSSYVFDKNFRQQGDETYYQILQEIRQGTISLESIEHLAVCKKKELDPNEEVQPTKLFPIKKQVDDYNQSHLRICKKNTPQTYKYAPKIYYEDTEVTQLNKIKDKKMQTEIEYVMKNSMYEMALELCVGCQVMCIYNVDQERKLVNGSQGTVIDFQYIAEKNQYYPVIRFEYMDEPYVMQEQQWNIESNEKYNVRQLPLILSWAITIHKSQGLSIDKAYIDIGSNIFECGQTYVALSRVKSLDGLYLKNLNINKIKANPKVIDFYKSICKAK